MEDIFYPIVGYPFFLGSLMTTEVLSHTSESTADGDIYGTFSTKNSNYQYEVTPLRQDYLSQLEDVIVKFNGGRLALLCKSCNVTIREGRDISFLCVDEGKGFKDDCYCPECLKKF